VDGHTAVCFDAPRAELIDARAEPLHPALAGLGPDLAAGPPDPATVLARMRAGERDESSVAEVLLDQAAVAGLGNAYRSEVLFVERVDPFAPVRDLPDEALVRLVATGSRLLRANLGGGPRSTLPGGLGRGLWVYGRASRPCRRCGSAIRSVLTGARPRRLYWCPSCQAPRAGQ
jgi:endonuclease-8